MAVYIARCCPMCRNYFGVVIGEPNSESNVGNPFTVGALHAGMRLTRRSFQVMAQSAIDKISPGPTLDALTAEQVFGWKNVHKNDDRDGFYGKRQDKAGYWRLAKVPPYSTNFLDAYSIERRMERLGRLDRYLRQLFRITHANNIPSAWASPEQRCRAAIKAVGQYGQVIPLTDGRKQIQK